MIKNDLRRVVLSSFTQIIAIMEINATVIIVIKKTVDELQTFVDELQTQKESTKSCYEIELQNTDMKNKELNNSI